MRKIATRKYNFYSFYGYNYLARLLVKYALSGLSLEEATIKRIREAEAQGVVVYAIKYPSLLDCLAIYELLKRERLPLPQYAHGINTAPAYSFSDLWRLFVDWIKGILLLSPSSAKKKVLLRKNLERGRSIIFHLGSFDHYNSKETETVIRQMLALPQDRNKNIIIVPMLVAYGRRREKQDENIVGIVFSQTEYTGPIRRLITFIRYAHRVIVMAGEPIDFNRYLDEHNLTTERLSSEIRSDLLDSIDREKLAIVGPPLKSTKDIIDAVLNDESITKMLEKIAGGDKKAFAALSKKARRRLQEIAAGYDEIYISIMDFFFSWLWNNIYDGIVVDKEGLARIREIAKKMPFIIIPCHRSHIDYLLFSYVLYKNNLPLPFIAAGANMMFWPMGPIFRRCGAFFLRRSFQGDELYRTLFSSYLQKLIEEGVPLEFFIEGGRSRTGKMIMPKYGLLSMVIQAFHNGVADNLALIPVYLGYDRIVEESSYLHELGGGDKKTENAADIIKSSSILKKRFGHVYVNIGKAITLKEYLATLPVPFAELPNDDRRALYRKIGYEIALNIANVSVVTPFSMIAAALLSHDHYGISHEDLLECLESFQNYLEFRNTQFAETLAHESNTIKNTIKKFEESKYISKISTDEEEEEEIEVVYSLEDDKRLAIEYYKNNILHFFLPISFFALSTLHQGNDEVSLREVHRDYSYLKRLFRHEFIFDDNVEDITEIEEIVAYLKMRGKISVNDTEQDTKIVVRGMGRKRLERFAALTKNYIESYWVVVRSLHYLKKRALPAKEFLKKTMVLGNMLHKKGEIRRAEALSHVNYLNALRYLRERGIILEEHRKEKGDSKRTTKYYSLSTDKFILEAVRRDLFRFVR